MNPPWEWISPDYLVSYRDHIPPDQRSLIQTYREQREGLLYAEDVRVYREAVTSVRDMTCTSSDLSGDIVTVGRIEDVSPEQKERWLQALHAFCPWKKGPFSLLGTEIDAEWRSDWKWNRIVPHIQPLTQRKVADIGCHNGYFMFRMAHHQPACVIGFEPYAKHFWNYQLIQNFLRLECLFFELLGVEHIGLYPRFFDTIFCLGILYHHTDPIGMLRNIHQALAPGGEVVVDCQGIPGDMPVALTPRGRYAKARGIWFLPTQSCLEHWMIRAGFTRVRCIYAEPLSIQEQRPTLWAPIHSLQDFLDPLDSSRTIEGYPAPWRYYMIANKGA